MKSKETKKAGTKFALIRALKLYFLGVLIQGGTWFSDDNYEYGWNLATIRFMGILNRIAFAYFVVAVIELWLPKVQISENRNPHLAIFIQQTWGWIACTLLVAAFLMMTFLTYVPSWQSHYRWTSEDPPQKEYLGDDETITIECNIRGHISTPECSAQGFYDRALFG